MVRFLKRGQNLDKSLDGEGMFEIAGPHAAHSMVMEGGALGGSHVAEERVMFRSQGARPSGPSLEGQMIGWALDRSMDRAPKSRLSKEGGGGNGGRGGPPSDVEMMKERFAKLLLGEDMSGGGKGVSSALALSNAITNLAASVFGEQKRLEPMPSERKARWRKEIDWLLSVTDHIVEFVPSQQMLKDGTNMEIMSTQQRRDLHMNIPALRKLDAMLLGYLDNFKDHNEFWYTSRDEDSEKGSSTRKDDKWWLPTVKVPSQGLSEVSKKWLQFQKESVNQVLKAAMAINAQIVMEMEIPEAYIESLPKNGRVSLGDSLYRSITVDSFDPEQFLSSLDLSSEHKVVDLKNRIEASIVIWKRKMHNKDGKSSWGSTVSLEKREQFEERAETILLLIKQRFPGIPQSALDISKIQFNKDVGQSILESYSRILESLAFTVMSRIEDVLDADALTQNPTQDGTKRRQSSSESVTGPLRRLDPKEELDKLNSMDPPSMTLSDFMGWHVDPDSDSGKGDLGSSLEFLQISEETTPMKKPLTAVTDKKFSYIDNLGVLRSPTARH